MNSLPDNLKQEALDFIEFLAQKSGTNKERIKPQFGSAKGLIEKMSADFDEPLDDFKEYILQAV